MQRCQRTNYHNTTNSGYLLEPLHSHDIRIANKLVPKYCEIFDTPLEIIRILYFSTPPRSWVFCWFYYTHMGLFGGREDILANPYSPRTNISIRISVIYQHWIKGREDNISIFSHCCIVARTTWLTVSRKSKRYSVSQARQTDRSRKRSRSIALKGRQSVVRPTSDVTPTARD